MRSDGLSATHIRSAVVSQVLCAGNRQSSLVLKKQWTRSLLAVLAEAAHEDGRVSCLRHGASRSL